ncbi:hemerythrin domain-containing protein [Saccharopolyspora erythraea]|uniref:hemerythrin domain-containing protein n=1 Tax=Saccharopolyspora erythraea TaxID=1836 RepID=UPI001BAC134F|nr:hemerythrin domain-containing protein [Saccharopolyspora erythraea]QUH03590.1 hemerythrin domain-containing protein [Saccharopolyspora erythraea]
MPNNDNSESSSAAQARTRKGPWGDDPLRTAERPHLPKPQGSPPARQIGGSGSRLVLIHDHLRQEMKQLREAVARVADGTSDAATARSAISNLTMQRNYRNLGSFCGSYCRILTLHHTIEDRALFPEIAMADQSVEPVVKRLDWEHEVIAEVCTALDTTLMALINGEGTIADVQEIVETLDQVLSSHLDYEEDELVGPISRLNITV